MTAPGRFRLGLGPLLAILLIAGLAVYLSVYPLWHTDVWAHAKYGEWYATHQRSPGVEPLSPYSDKEARFPDVAWLSQTAYHAIYRFGARFGGDDPSLQLKHGAEALRTFHWLLLLARFAILWLALRRFGGSDHWATLGVFLYMMAVGFGSAVQRPQAFGLFFFTATLLAISTPTVSRRSLLWLPISFALWANLHGTFLAGLTLLGLHVVGRLIETRRLDADMRRLCLLGLLCLFATLANPHGPWLYRDVLAFSGHPNLKTMSEWEPMRLSAESGSHWPYLMSVLLLVFVRVLGGRKIGVAGALVALPFLVWPWLQARMLLWWWTVAVWLLARLGPGLADRFPTMPRLPNPPPSRVSAVIAAVAILAAAASFPPFWGRDPLAPETPWRVGLELAADTPDEGRWLAELRWQLRQNYPEGQFRGAIFASETQGDFLVWRLRTDQPVLMYTHAHIFSVEHWNACLNAKRAVAGWREFLAGHRVNLILVETSSHEELTAELRVDPEWIVIHDDATVLALRKSPR